MYIILQNALFIRNSTLIASNSSPNTSKFSKAPLFILKMALMYMFRIQTTLQFLNFLLNLLILNNFLLQLCTNIISNTLLLFHFALDILIKLFQVKNLTLKYIFFSNFLLIKYILIFFIF